MAPRPLADPAKLLATWMEWERGEATPGRVIASLKTAGLRTLLEQLAGGKTTVETELPDSPGPAGTSEPGGGSAPGGVGSSLPR